MFTMDQGESCFAGNHQGVRASRLFPDLLPFGGFASCASRRMGGRIMDVRKSILIIDHEADLYPGLIALFQQSRYSCSWVENGLKALAALKRGQYDLALLGLQDVEGTGLIAMLRRLYPALPVLVLSWDDSAESHRRALQNGASGYLLKPLDDRQVLYCVQEIFREAERVRRRARLMAKKAVRKVRV